MDKRTCGVTLAASLLLAALIMPAAAQKFTLGESQLAGIRLQERPTVLLRAPSYGPPDAVIASGGVFNTRMLIQTEGGGPPPWAQAVWVDGLTQGQVVWIYNRQPVAVAFVITGEGDEAEITDVIVSLWEKMTASSWAETKKGIRLGDTFMKVMLKYGFPETLSVFQGGATAAPAAGGPGALPAAAGSPMLSMAGGASRFGFRSRNRRDEEDFGSAPTVTPVAPAPGSRAGPLPPAAPVAGPTFVERDGHFSGVVMGQQINLSKHMVMGYPQQGIDFYLYDMRVVRIHVYTVSAGVAPTGPGTVASLGTGLGAYPTRMPTAVTTPGSMVGLSGGRLRFGLSGRRDRRERDEE